MKRLSFLLLLIVCLSCLAGLASAAASAKPIASLEGLRALRKQATERQRRLIFNNDGNEPVYLCKTTAPEDLLSHRTTPLAGSQVDSLFYCTWSSGFSVFTHGTKVGQVMSSKEGLFSPNMTTEMLAAGTDPLRVMTDFGHKNNMEVFWSFRMNDTHDGSTADYGPIMFRYNRLKNEHPDWLIGASKQKPKFGAWSAVDYTRPEIRDLAFRYVEEVCQNYDVEGFELDFFRHPVFFKRAATTGTECNDEERGMMTEMMRRIRTMTEAEGMKRGRPILVSIRVPDSVEYCRAIGIDLEHWLSEGLVDLLMVSGYFQLNEWNYSVALGRKHGVKVYASLDESRVRDPLANKLRSSVACYRGRALAAWQAGVDGVYLFNAFDPKNPIWKELHSPATLAALDHSYFASVRGYGAAAGGSYLIANFIRVPVLNPAKPIVLNPGEPAQVTFNAGNETAIHEKERAAAVVLRVQFKTSPSPDSVTVALNGTVLDKAKAQDNWLAFPVDPKLLKPGSNEVQVTIAGQSPRNDWTDLHCTVRFPQ